MFLDLYFIINNNNKKDRLLMKQKKMLTLTFSQLKQIYNQEIPELVEIAEGSVTVDDFKAGLLKFLESCGMKDGAAEEAREQIRLLLQYDGVDVHELSTGQDMPVRTIRLLYEFLTGTLEKYGDADGFVY